jgi:hypothetical protein
MLVRSRSFTATASLLHACSYKMPSRRPAIDARQEYPAGPELTRCSTLQSLQPPPVCAGARYTVMLSRKPMVPFLQKRISFDFTCVSPEPVLLGKSRDVFIKLRWRNKDSLFNLFRTDYSQTANHHCRHPPPSSLHSPDRGAHCTTQVL